MSYFKNFASVQWFIVALSVLSIQRSYGQYALSSHQNYILTSTPRTAVSNGAELSSLSAGEVSRVVEYFDGLGRSMQQIQIQASPGGNDIVQPIEYDAQGRQSKQYLPYVSTLNAGSYRPNALSVSNTYAQSEQFLFYQQGAADIAANSHPYSQTIFEASPLNRVLEQGAPGSAWQTGTSHSVKAQYQTNSASEVRSWNVTAGGASGAVYYPAGSLLKTTIVDENGSPSVEFKDKLGQVVMTQSNAENGQVSTYYVYDDLGNLRYVIPPVPDNPVLSSFAESSSVFRNFIYGYHYDGRKRVTEKKIPGKDWEHMVYNQQDQLVLSQDGNQRISNQWLFYKYDALDRLILKGVLNSTNNRTAWENLFKQQTGWEQRDESNTNGTGYTGNNCMPYHSQIAQYYSINYYDDYSFRPSGATYSPSLTVSSRTRSFLTGSKTNILGSSTMLLSVYYYDEEGRMVEGVEDNHKSGLDRTSTTYNFSGEVIATNRTHSSNQGNVTTQNFYTYDHAGRERVVKQNIIGANGTTSSAVVLSRKDYNELGQLVKKYLHSSDYSNPSIPAASSFLYPITYNYHLRGWLSGINSPEFCASYGYESGSRYNGDITSVSWGTAAAPSARIFNYQYNQASRLLNASSQDMSETNISADDLGNLLSLTRDGTVFNYNYNYSGERGNLLNSVSNASNGLTYHFTYDKNGNILRDEKNGVMYSNYNLFNLPGKVTGIQSGSTYASYTYDAEGNKLSNGTSDYIAGVHYRNGNIEFIQTEEGQARRSGNSYVYEYHVQDHLGNTRVAFYKNPNTQQLEVFQREDYYAFGLNKSRMPISSSNTNYLYNGKEQQEWGKVFDYGARFYDPELARWNQVDQLSELMVTHSPFNYAFNSPVNFIDPDGNAPTDWYESLSTGAIKWFDGSGQIDGWTRLFEQGSLISKVGGNEVGRISLYKDGTAYDHYTKQSSNDASLYGKAEGKPVIAKGQGSVLNEVLDVTSGGAVSGMQEALDVRDRDGHQAYLYHMIGLAHREIAYDFMSGAYHIGGGRRGPTGTTALRKVGSVLESIDDVMANPSLIKGQSYGYIRNMLGKSKGWINSTMTKTRGTDKGWVLRQVNGRGQETGKLIQYHPGSRRHFGGAPYWKVSDGARTIRFPAN